MSCQQPTHSVNQSQLRKEILEGINNEYEVLKRSLESGSQVDPGINDDIIEGNNMSNESIAGSDVGSIMDLDDFEKSF